MDKDKIIELENYFFETKAKSKHAAGVMADIVGVLIGLKPAMMGDYMETELEGLNVKKLEEKLDGLGLKGIFLDHFCLSGDERVKIKIFFVSKRIKTAEQIRDAFVELWLTMNDGGKVLDKKRWKEVTKKIGDLLGYPKTAVESFVREDDYEDEGRIRRMERNRYYAHSAKYEEKEFRLYDQKLNKAISDLAPKTADFFSNEKNKRWLD